MLQGLSSAVKKAEGEISVQLADLLVFLGYFALILYVGGIAYIRGYNNGWSFPVLSDQGVAETAVIFLDAVFTTAGQAILFSAAIIVLAALFFVARFALRLWIGYLTILSLFVLLLLGSALLGHKAGGKDALTDKLSDRTTLPAFKAETEEFRTAEFHLLHETDDRLLVFRPVDLEQSDVLLRVLKRSDYADYEVTLK